LGVAGDSGAAVAKAHGHKAAEIIKDRLDGNIISVGGRGKWSRFGNTKPGAHSSARSHIPLATIGILVCGSHRVPPHFEEVRLGVPQPHLKIIAEVPGRGTVSISKVVLSCQIRDPGNRHRVATPG
jgi:hypothetical protein